MEKLQEVAGKQEMLMGALAHEMKTPLTSIIGYSDTLRHVKLNDEQKDCALEHISREGKRLEKLSGKMLQMLGLHQNDSIKNGVTRYRRTAETGSSTGSRTGSAETDTITDRIRRFFL